MPVAPVQNMLAKTMVGHITFALVFGTAAATVFWNKQVLPARETRAAFYQKYNAERSA